MKSLDGDPWAFTNEDSVPQSRASDATGVASLDTDLDLDADWDTLRSRTTPRRKYVDGDTIDWFEEEARARLFDRKIQTRRGVKGIAVAAVHNTTLWVVVICTGIGVGIIGAWLDILVAWLADIRLGRCGYNFLYNQSTCCKGYDVGEVCQDWLSWSDFFGVRWIAVQSLMQSTTYVILSIAFAAASAVLVQVHAPYAFHTGIPEIKAILGGFVLDEFLSAWTLLIKATGLGLSVASGLSLGKEGPLVHVACCMANLVMTRLPRFKYNQVEKRRVLAAAAAAGVSVAFGSPLGGVLFGLEELGVYHGDVMWLSFVASAIAAVSLQYIDPFGTAKLVLFQVTHSDQPWRFFELIPWTILGIAGGLVGSLLIRLNVAAALYRQRSDIKNYPILEVVVATGITAAVSYMVVFMRVPTSELVSYLFQECTAGNDYHGLCNTSAFLQTVFLLLVSAMLKVALTAWTFGMMVPAGIFLPTIAIGACIGRAMGLVVQAFYRQYPNSFIFASCPPDPTVGCISPGFYAVIGAAATLAGVTRMTISLVVILFELTGALSHVLPIMIVVMSSKWVADSFGKEGIYALWIAMRRYPWVSSTEYRDGGRTSVSYMTPADNVTLVDEDVSTVGHLSDLVHKTRFRGYPVTRRGVLLGYVTRATLEAALVSLGSPSERDRETKCAFSKSSRANGSIDFSRLVETPTLILRKEVPLELVVSIFQKMNLRYLLFARDGRLTGLLTKRDIVSLMTMDIADTGVLDVDMSPTVAEDRQRRSRIYH